MSAQSINLRPTDPGSFKNLLDDCKIQLTFSGSKNVYNEKYGNLGSVDRIATLALDFYRFGGAFEVGIIGFSDEREWTLAQRLTGVELMDRVSELYAESERAFETAGIVTWIIHSIGKLFSFFVTFGSESQLNRVRSDLLTWDNSEAYEQQLKEAPVYSSLGPNLNITKEYLRSTIELQCREKNRGPLQDSWKNWLNR